tara:strand:- start:37 stop:330 length:294 start_codon:yes stop_codon:yes gene_type:complete
LESGIDAKIIDLFIVLEKGVPKQFIGKSYIRFSAHKPKIGGVPWFGQIKIIIAEDSSQAHIGLKTIPEFRIQVGSVSPRKITAQSGRQIIGEQTFGT